MQPPGRLVPDKDGANVIKDIVKMNEIIWILREYHLEMDPWFNEWEISLS